MQTPDYDNIAPLIVNQQVHRRTAEFTLRCPVSGEEVRANTTLPQPTELGGMATQIGRRSLFQAVRGALFSAIHRAFGHGIFGRLIAEVIRSTVQTLERERGELSATELREAAVEAFRGVSHRFIWEPQGKRWIAADAAAELLSDFDRRLAAAPIQHPYDQGVLARMLVEVSRSDGRVSSDEAGWLTQYIAASEGSIEGLGGRPALTAAELGETTAAVRESLLMLAWAVALVDEEFDAREETLLGALADGLGLPDVARYEAAEAARAYVLEQALERMVTWGGHDEHARDELNAMAARIGVDRDAVEQVEARYLRRRGSARAAQRR